MENQQNISTFPQLLICTFAISHCCSLALRPVSAMAQQLLSAVVLLNNHSNAQLLYYNVASRNNYSIALLLRHTTAQWRYRAVAPSCHGTIEQMRNGANVQPLKYAIVPTHACAISTTEQPCRSANVFLCRGATIDRAPTGLPIYSRSVDYSDTSNAACAERR